MKIELSDTELTLIRKALFHVDGPQSARLYLRFCADAQPKSGG